MTFETRNAARFPTAILLALAVTVASVAAADARPGGRKARPNSYGYSYGYQPPAGRGDSPECDRARDADPGGDYASYPCWAQWAFAPKRPGR
jgi:hypothetical protein